MVERERESAVSRDDLCGMLTIINIPFLKGYIRTILKELSISHSYACTNADIYSPSQVHKHTQIQWIFYRWFKDWEDSKFHLMQSNCHSFTIPELRSQDPVYTKAPITLGPEHLMPSSGLCQHPNHTWQTHRNINA